MSLEKWYWVERSKNQGLIVLKFKIIHKINVLVVMSVVRLPVCKNI